MRVITAILADEHTPMYVYSLQVYAPINISGNIPVKHIDI